MVGNFYIYQASILFKSLKAFPMFDNITVCHVMFDCPSNPTAGKVNYSVFHGIIVGNIGFCILCYLILMSHEDHIDRRSHHLISRDSRLLLRLCEYCTYGRSINSSL